MDKLNDFLFELCTSTRYVEILQGKNGYTNIVKRQEALGNHFQDLLNKYLQDSDEASFQKIGGKEYVKSKAEEIINMLNECCDAFLSGDIADAINMMYNCYFKDGIILKTIQLISESTFYRMRKASDYKIFDKEEMFHIPFEKNYLVRNERFSISGFPSLYLGKSVYVCWEEVGRPNFDQANIAVFKNQEDCTVIDLSMPTKDIIDYLLTLPMILSSSLPVLHPDCNFKPEYIIPQLLMQCVVRYNNDSHKKPIDGIKYDSTHKYDRNSFYDYRVKGLTSLYDNYVFPARKRVDEGQCPVLSELFRFCGSDSFARYELEDYGSAKVQEGILGEYEKSKFSAMEKHLFQVAKGSSMTYKSFYGAQAFGPTE